MSKITLTTIFALITCQLKNCDGRACYHKIAGQMIKTTKTAKLREDILYWKCFRRMRRPNGAKSGGLFQ